MRAVPSRPVGPAAYVGRPVCAECHPHEAERWLGSHHDRAMQVAEVATILGDFEDARLTHHDGESTFYRRQEEYWLQTLGPGGELGDYRISYAFGVAPLQQYLVESPGGRLQALSWAWDSRPRTVGGQRWFHLYPAEELAAADPLHWTGSLQNWNSMCAECHSTAVRKSYDLETDRYTTELGEIDVSCEACHGPGSRHIEWAQGAVLRSPGLPTSPGEVESNEPAPGLLLDLSDRDGAIWSFEPGSVIAQRSVKRISRTEIETCAHCHSRRTVLEDPYEPGGRFFDRHRLALLEEGLYYPDGQVQGEVYVYGSFLQSKMHRRGVSCGDCHDPHSLELHAAGNRVCATCHLVSHFDTPAHHHHQPGESGSFCVDCHMPQRTYMVVDARRDHSLRIPRPDLTEKIGVPNPCNGCHTHRDAQWSTDRMIEWSGTVSRDRHYGESLAAGRLGLTGAEPLLTATVRDPDVPGIVRATALGLLGRYPTPRALAVVKAGLRDPDPLVRLGALRGVESLDLRSRMSHLYPLLTDPMRSVRIEAARLLAASPSHDLTLYERAEIDRVLLEYRESQWANAERPESHLNLGLLHLDRGELEAAEAEYRTALRLDSTFAPAYVNLADLYRARGRDREGEVLLRQGVERLPRAADLHHALGLVLVRRRRLPEALAELGRAAELGPGDPRNPYVYGVALHDSGNRDGALEVLLKAHETHPGDREILVALASFEQESGDVEAAAAWVERLVALVPDDPAFRQWLAELEVQR